ncbi:MAG TPA: menaquinol-cytochrome c reductase cytochrome b subunit [Microthrixaceae bacterium]|nr:menaquinol-cytochrome c reductase cytochrome b subunit [Microthrixaceae bacterium]HNE75447.1 menaquinol-cytochrome c reductase cytochrome b subunit [Microthrixaceae bacterium]HNO46062.1 menaquinol-cytochrome c reductase cytochrome b subunit [Microthrixaceae bacterium]
MTEVPEHLLKRAQAAKEKAAAQAAADAPADAPAAADEGAAAPSDSRIPAHLLARSQAAKAKKSGGDADAPAASGGGGTATAVATAPAAGAPVAAAGGPPLAAGPGGHTQRLLTVVKSGSIQDVKAKPQDKVHVWPHLLVIEFVAALVCTVFLLIFSWLVNAPLLELANVNQTPNPSKAPWYFLGLQELLTMFHPMVAGVTIPGMGIFILILAPYMDKNPSNKPEDRKFAVSLMTLFLMFWAVIAIIGSFFRGPGFNFTLPWIDGVFFEL